MGVFDLFGREPRMKTETRNANGASFSGGATAASNDASANPITVFVPKSFSEVETIIDSLKKGKPAVVHLDQIKTDTAVRILDMLSGAIYALGGGVYEMGKNIFMFSPSGLEVNA